MFVADLLRAVYDRKQSALKLYRLLARRNPVIRELFGLFLIWVASQGETLTSWRGSAA